MNLLESLDKAFLTLYEDVESRMHHLLQIILGKKSRWPLKDKPDAEKLATDYIRDISQYDPTQGKNYMQYLAKQVAAGLIRLPEDGPPLKETLEKFMNWSRKPAWKQVAAKFLDPKAPPNDIMSYTHWRELQKVVMEYEKDVESKNIPTSETAWVNKAKEGAERVLDMTLKTESGTRNYVVTKVATPVAVTVYGRGTQWCTSCSLYKTIRSSELDNVVNELTKHKEKIEGDPWANLTAEAVRKIISDLNGGDLNKKELKVPNTYYDSALRNAKNYLSGGPMYIIMRDGKPYIQMTNSARELRNVEDASLKTTSAALSVIFRALMGEPQPPEVEKAIISSQAKPNEVSTEMKKTLNDHIRRSEAARARALAQAQRQQPPQ